MSGTLGGRVPVASRTAPIARRKLPPVNPNSPPGWTELTAPPSPFDDSLPPCVVLTDGADQLLVGGGLGSDDFWVYDTGDDSYTGTTAFPSGTDSMGGEYANGKSWVFDPTSPAQTPYSWDAGTWTGETAGNNFGANLTTCEAGGLIYVLNGGLESYDPVNDSWTTLATPVNGQVGFDTAIVESGGIIYAFADTVTSAYTIGTDTWDNGLVLAPRTTLCFGSAYALIGGKVYLAGGYQGATKYDTLDIYDIAGDSWESGTAMASLCRSPWGAVLGGKFYVFGTGPSPTFTPFARFYNP